MSTNKTSSILFFISMLLACLLSTGLKPEQKLVDTASNDQQFAQLIPEAFETWQYIPQYSVTIVSPELNDLLSTIYDQIVSRFYKNSQGDLIMLSVSYGQQQIDDGSLHLPEVCYPAQGFSLEEKPASSTIQTKFGPLKVKRLYVKKDNREEFITYWTMLGHTNVRGSWETKYEQIKYGLQGTIPDGLIFRISSIGKSDEQTISLHNAFIHSFLASIDSNARVRLTGLQ